MGRDRLRGHPYPGTYRLILPGHGFTPAHGYASLTADADIL